MLEFWTLPMKCTEDAYEKTIKFLMGTMFTQKEFQWDLLSSQEGVCVCVCVLQSCKFTEYEYGGVDEYRNIEEKENGNG